MKLVSVFAASILFLAIALYVAVRAINMHNAHWQIEQEQISVRDFSNNRGAYEDLIRHWTQLFPAKCGGAASPGFVTVHSITAAAPGLYSLDVNGQSSSGLNVDGLAKRLGVLPENVRSVTDLYIAVKSNEVIQSGAAIKIISLGNDTHGILHVDPDCSDATMFEAWSRSTSDSGPYPRVRSLGGGWYYFVEER